MKAYLYVLNTLADWETGFLTAELTSKRYFKNHNDDFQLIKVGSTKNSVKTMGGLIIHPDITTGDIDTDKENIIILPGAETWFEPDNRDIIKLAKERIESGLKVAAICGATGALAKAGALNNIKHTSNDKEYIKLFYPEYTGEAFYLDKPAIKDENLITASGLAPVEFTYEIITSLKVFREETSEAWYNLYTKRELKYYYELVNSLEK